MKLHTQLSLHDIPVDYDDAEHKYSHGSVRYLSATQLLEHFIPKFDAEAESIKMADKWGHTPDYWKRKWRKENVDSLYRGDNIHDREEQELYRQKFVKMNPVNLPVLNAAELSTVYYNLPDGVYPEMKLWRHDHKIAGRSDKVILTTWGYADPIRTANIEDFKTNKRLRKFGYQAPDGTTRKLLGPLSHIEDGEYWHYTLQLSVYQYMLEYFGFYPGKRTIIHFPHQIEGLPPMQPVRYELPYLRDEVKAMIFHVNKTA